MTSFQWKVVMALVRAVLVMSGIRFTDDANEQLGREDRAILLDAVDKDFKERQPKGTNG